MTLLCLYYIIHYGPKPHISTLHNNQHQVNSLGIISGRIRITLIETTLLSIYPDQLD